LAACATCITKNTARQAKPCPQFWRCNEAISCPDF
jgi:hypothetical protein